MTTFQIAQTQDAGRLANLRRRSWEAAYRGIYRDELLDGYDMEEHTARILRQIENPDYRVYVIESDGVAVGFLMFSRWDTPLYKNFPVCLNALYLVPEAFRQGIGRQAVNLTSDWCRENGYDSFFLSCSLHNRRARAFYEAMGGVLGDVDGGHTDRGADTCYYEYYL